MQLSYSFPLLSVVLLSLSNIPRAACRPHKDASEYLSETATHIDPPPEEIIPALPEEFIPPPPDFYVPDDLPIVVLG